MNPLKSATTLLLALLLVVPPLFAADSPSQHDRYALQLEARPSAVFSFLDKLGRVTLSVYPQGVRVDSLWLDGYLKSGSETVRIENPALRMYTDASYVTLRRLFRGMAPEEKTMKLGALPVVKTARRGTIKNLPVTCYRIQLGKNAWIDVWSNETLKKSQAYANLQMQVLTTISPDLARAAAKIPGTPLHVVLNTEKYPETTLLSTRQAFRSSAGQEEALQTGRFFLRVPSIDPLVK